MLDTIVLRSEYLGKMSDDEFFRFCQENSQLRIERNHHLEIIIMSPTGSLDGLISGEVYFQLRVWNEIHGTGFVFDSSSGFTLPDHSVRSPDAGWVSSGNWLQVPTLLKVKFAPICPEFIIEVKSSGDAIDHLHEKMKRWIINGAVSGLLVDPDSKTTWLYTADGKSLQYDGFDTSVTPGAPVEGFSLDLRKIEKLLQS